MIVSALSNFLFYRLLRSYSLFIFLLLAILLRFDLTQFYQFHKFKL